MTTLVNPCNSVNPADRSSHAAAIARLFELPSPLPPDAPVVPRPLPALPQANQILLITGPSGAGKSTLLRQLSRPSRLHSDTSPIPSRRRAFVPPCLPPRFLHFSAIHPPRRLVIDCFGTMGLEKVLLQLSRVGLGEVWTYLRPTSELSAGQHWRLRLALALAAAHRKAPRRLCILLIDEFAALLDRVTAATSARCLRRAVSSTPNFAALVATSHDDLVNALTPDNIITCDF